MGVYEPFVLRTVASAVISAGVDPINLSAFNSNNRFANARCVFHNTARLQIIEHKNALAIKPF